MKKFLFLFALIMVGVGLTGCQNSAKSKLKHSLEAFNQNCPQSLGMIGEVTSMTYDEGSNEVQMNFTFDDEMMSIDYLKNNEKLMKQSMILASSDRSMRDAYRLMADAGASLNIIMRTFRSNEVVSVLITNSDIKEMLSNPGDKKANLESRYQLSIQMARSSYPEVIDEGMTIVDIIEDKGYTVYVCELDEDLYDIDVLKENVSEIKATMAPMLEDPVFREMGKLITQTGRKGLIYRYKGDQTGKAVNVVFSSSELARK